MKHFRKKLASGQQTENSPRNLTCGRQPARSTSPRPGLCVPAPRGEHWKPAPWLSVLVLIWFQLCLLSRRLDLDPNRNRLFYYPLQILQILRNRCSNKLIINRELKRCYLLMTTDSLSMERHMLLPQREHLQREKSKDRKSHLCSKSKAERCG